MNIRSVEVAGTSLRLRAFEAPDGVPIVFWHSLGLAGNASFFDVAAPPLVAAGFSTYALDAPGYGGSPARDRDGYGVDQLAGLLWELVDELGLALPIVLSGHSWGGTIAITAAAARPDDVSALVLFDSGHVDYADMPDAKPEATIDELIAELEAEPMPDRWDELVTLLAEHGLHEPWTLAAWREGFDVDPEGRIRRLSSTVALAASRVGLMQARASAAWPAVHRARIPTLVLLATEPPELRDTNAAAAERMRAVIPDAEIRPVEGMTHAAFAELGPTAGVTVAEWLRTAGVAGRRSP